MICLDCGESLRRVEYPTPGIIVEFVHEEGVCRIPAWRRNQSLTILERLLVDHEQARSLIEPGAVPGLKK